MNERATTRQSAITLIELLIVISLIAILTSILLPAIYSSRQTALRTQCQSNMRQVVLGIRSLPDDFHELGETEQAEAMLKERRVRICPLDPNGQTRLEARGSSYVDNRPKCDFDEQMATSKTIVLFEAAETASTRAVDPCEWFSTENVTAHSIVAAISAAIETRRHGEVSNYAYADGHVQSIPASAVQAWADQRFNFGLRNRGEYNP